MKYRNFIVAFALIAMEMSICGCKSDFNPTSIPPPYEDENEDEDENEKGSIILPDAEVVEVSYTESSNLKYVQVLINDRINKDMIFDTGASYTQITLKEAQYLYSENILTDDDVLGTEKFGDANGNITENMVVNLRKIVLGGELTITNVKATIVENGEAPLLLGQTVLEKLPQYTIDNKKKVIVFKIK